MSLGLGVMIGALAGVGQKSATEITKALGKTIRKAELSQDVVRLYFTDGSHLAVEDDGQSCCERRYMSTDDDIGFLAGKVLVGVQVKDAPDIEDEDGEYHEVQFLEVMTNKGCVTFAAHNEHNGYYGGFHIVASYYDAVPDED